MIFVVPQNERGGMYVIWQNEGVRLSREGLKESEES